MISKDELRLLDEMGKPDADNLADAQSRPWFQRLLGTMVRELDGKRQQLSNIDLAEEKGRLDGIKLQGEIAGMSRFLDCLMEKKEIEESE